MKYYRYMSFKRGMEVLRTGHFRLSPISCFNDPFDGYGVTTRSMTDEACWYFVKRFRKNLQRMFVSELGQIESLINASDEEYVDIVQETLKNPRQAYFVAEAVREWLCSPQYQLMCLSSVDDYDGRNDILMWSHYADSSKGMRFEIEITDEDILPGFSFRKMKYSDSRPLLDLSKVRTWDYNDAEFNRYLDDCMCMKSKAWQYESEVRFIADMEKCKYNIRKGYDDVERYNYAYVIFPSNVIRKVVFGVSANRVEVEKVCKKLRRDKTFGEVEFLQMELNLKNYDIEYTSLI